MDDIRIEKIVRSRRRTIALIITPDARLIVRAPLRAPAAMIDAVIREKSGWIHKKLGEMKGRPQAVVHTYDEGEIFWFLGRPYPLHLDDEPGTGIRRMDRLCVSRTRVPDIRSAIQRWYMAEAHTEIHSRCMWFSMMTGYSPTSVRITDATQRWGSCNHRGGLFSNLLRGLLSSAATIVPSSWFPSVAKYCVEHPGTDMGVHITLNCEWSAYRWGALSTCNPDSGLLDSDGYLHKQPPATYEHATPEAVQVEIQAQVQRIGKASRYRAADADGDRLNYTVQYSADGGQTWQAIALGLQDTILRLESLDILRDEQERRQPSPLAEGREGPGVSQDGRGHAEGHQVRQGVVLGPELAGRVRHPGDPAVQPVEDQGRHDGPGGRLELPLHGNDDGVEAAQKARRGEQVRQDVDSLLHAVAHPSAFLVHFITPRGVSPARVLSPTFTETVDSRGRKTSRREPKRMSPKRSPRVTVMPSFSQQTILLATSPAI